MKNLIKLLIIIILLILWFLAVKNHIDKIECVTKTGDIKKCSHINFLKERK